MTLAWYSTTAPTPPRAGTTVGLNGKIGISSATAAMVLPPLIATTESGSNNSCNSFAAAKPSFLTINVPSVGVMITLSMESASVNRLSSSLIRSSSFKKFRNFGTIACPSSVRKIPGL